MHVVRNVLNMPPVAGRTALTIGNFDGFHRGHQALLERLVERAAARRATPALMCFEPMPRAYFAPADAPPRLASLREKIWAAKACGVGLFLCARFNRALASMSAHTFLSDVVARRLDAAYIAVGVDFRFGAGREGDFDMIREFGERNDIEVESVADVEVDGERVSSTRVRSALGHGDIGLASRLLGHDYRICERVVAGEALGRTLGFPTLNLRLGKRSALRFGVYAVTVDILDGPFVGQHRGGAASFGVRPTVDGREPLLEVYLLDFEGDLYGARVDVCVRAFIRDEGRFDDLDVMTAQMDQDVADVRAQLNEQGR